MNVTISKFRDEEAVWHRMMIVDEELHNRLRGNHCEESLDRFCNDDLNGMLSLLSEMKQFMSFRMSVHPAGTDLYKEDAPMSDNWLALNNEAKRHYLDRDLNFYMRN
jgi:hypothetical protein